MLQSLYGLPARVQLTVKVAHLGSGKQLLVFVFFQYS